MEIWIACSKMPDFSWLNRLHYSLDTFVACVTAGWVTEIDCNEDGSMWLVNCYGKGETYREEEFYVNGAPIPNALILFFVDIVKVN